MRFHANSVSASRERLARAASNRVFEPSALTEDYENGLRLARLKVHQAFVPISFDRTSGGVGKWLSTRSADSEPRPQGSGSSSFHQTLTGRARHAAL